jgi:hypothetical protein
MTELIVFLILCYLFPRAMGWLTFGGAMFVLLMALLNFF